LTLLSFVLAGSLIRIFPSAHQTRIKCPLLVHVPLFIRAIR